MPKKESSDRLARIASKSLKGGRLTEQEKKSLGASVLSQDETKGQRKPKRQPIVLGQPDDPGWRSSRTTSSTGSQELERSALVPPKKTIRVSSGRESFV